MTSPLFQENPAFEGLSIFKPIFIVSKVLLVKPGFLDKFSLQEPWDEQKQQPPNSQLS